MGKFLVLCDLEICWMTLKYNRAPLPYYVKVISKPSVNSILSYSPEMFNSGLNRRFFVPCDLGIWWMTLNNNRAPLLYYVKLCASFQSLRWIETWFTVRKCPIRIKVSDFLSCVTLKSDGWPWKTIVHLFYAPSSFVHLFIAITHLKLELQSGNAQFGSKSMIFCPVWPWNLTDDLEKQ